MFAGNHLFCSSVLVQEFVTAWLHVRHLYNEKKTSDCNRLSRLPQILDHAKTEAVALKQKNVQLSSVYKEFISNDSQE